MAKVIVLVASLFASVSCLPTSAGHSNLQQQAATIPSPASNNNQAVLFGKTVEVGKLHPPPEQQPSSSQAAIRAQPQELLHSAPVQPASSPAPPVTPDKGTAIKLFGATIHPSAFTAPEESSQQSEGLPEASPSSIADSASKDAPKRSYKKWINQHVHPDRQAPYYQLLHRLNIADNYSVKSHFIETLTDKEKQAIEKGDEAGIKGIIHSREYLVRYAPLEFPEERRPDEGRIERLKKKLAKVKSSMSSSSSIMHNTDLGRNRKGWYQHHDKAEAQAIREKTRQLHGRAKFDRNLNRKILGLTVEERRLALENDVKALAKLGPMKTGRPSNESKRKLDELVRAKEGSNGSTAKSSNDSLTSGKRTKKG